MSAGHIPMRGLELLSRLLGGIPTQDAEKMWITFLNCRRASRRSE
jgi:hypothetical protein